VTRADGTGFDLAVEVCCERCLGPSIILTGTSVRHAPRTARRLDAVLPCDCPTWRDRIVGVAQGVAVCAALYVLVCGAFLL
jgi:hypothetical protein